MSTQTRTVINKFTSEFGNTPNGVTPVKYGDGTSYTDASNSSRATVNGNNLNTIGEIEASNHVRTLFISVVNEKGDEQVDGVNLIAYSPQAITYQSNRNGITDPRRTQKLHFQGAQFLTLSEDGQTLVPLGRKTTNSITTRNIGSSGGGY